MEQVNLKLIPVLVLFMFLNTENTKAQQGFELGGTIGTMRYDGDIGDWSSRFPVFLRNKTSPGSFAGSFQVAYNFNKNFGFRVSFAAGSVQAADSLLSRQSTQALIKITRNLHFRSPISEVSFLGVIQPFDLTKSKRKFLKRFTPYVMLGVGFFKFNPMGWYENPSGPSRWVPLRPLRTEGQGMPAYPGIKQYALSTHNFQGGAGISCKLNSKLSAGFEILNRKTNTDYLDDVSGVYIDNTAFDQFFGNGTSDAAMAKQMANNPTYKQGGIYPNGFFPGSLRGSSGIKDYFYTTSMRISYRLGKSYAESVQRSRRGIMDCYQF